MRIDKMTSDGQIAMKIDKVTYNQLVVMTKGLLDDVCKITNKTDKGEISGTSYISDFLNNVLIFLGIEVVEIGEVKEEEEK